MRLQHENGVDVVNDGEYTKRSWQTYSRGRLERPRVPARAASRRRGPRLRLGSRRASRRDFPEFFATGLAGSGGAARGVNVGAPTSAGRPPSVFCVGPLTYIGQEEYKRDIAYIKEAAAQVQPASTELCADGAGAGHDRALAAQRVLHDAKKRSSSPSPTRCTRSTRRSPTPASSCSSTTRTCRTASTCIPT